MAALVADGTSTLRNIESWRVKETDRIAAMAAELRKLGASVEEGADYQCASAARASGLRRHASIDTYDDHRMAMCFSLAALGGVAVRINDPDCVIRLSGVFQVLASDRGASGMSRLAPGHRDRRPVRVGQRHGRPQRG